ncbi:MAG: hypothetical protein ACO1NW_18965 [Chitinophagaceae bacterium]
MRLLLLFITVIICASVSFAQADPDSLSDADRERLFALADKWEMYGVDSTKKNPFQLKQTFNFNKKIYFTAKTSEVNISSYFYLSTKTGLTGYDKDVAKQMGKAYSTLEFAIKMNDGNHFAYQLLGDKTKLASVLKEGPGFLPQYLEDLRNTEHFKDYFEPTGDKVKIGDKEQHSAIRYQGVNMEGGQMNALLADNPGQEINPDHQLMILSVFGIGFIFLEGKTQLLAGWESDGYVARLVKIEDVHFTFDGTVYQTYQEKADQKISGFLTAMQKDSIRQSAALERREAELRRRRERISSAPNSEQLRQMDEELLSIKKAIVRKKEEMQKGAASKASKVAEKEGEITVLRENVFAATSGNQVFEIAQLEMKKVKIENEKKLLKGGLSAENADKARKASACAAQRMITMEKIMEEAVFLDRKFRDDPKQLFHHKMNLYTTRFIPLMQTPCR